MKYSNIKNIRNLGQSIWLDFFDREIMNSGKLDRLIKNDGLSGITSNPSIFEKAIASGSDYDGDIRALPEIKSDDEAVFFKLAVKDIQRATDMFALTHEQTNGEDGFVSLEVSPFLAHDTESTIRQATGLWKSVNRKNVMIKIPGTAEGLPAIKQCTSEGININITLLFGLPRYAEVTEAYISGLEERLKAGEAIDNIHSVASFFLSRIDVLTDPILVHKELKELKGEVAIASAKKAYQLYKEIFGSERFKQLEANGAKRQRVLWASTSTKDPTFSDVKYVEALIGPETINTLPLETIDAFNDHGKVENHLEEDLGNAEEVFVQLKNNGININAITQQLEDEGIGKFNAAYSRLLSAIDHKRKAVAR